VPGQPFAGGIQRRWGGCRQDQKLRRIVRAAGRRPGRLLDDEVNVCAADPEGADAGTQRRAALLRPRLQPIGHSEGPAAKSMCGLAAR
jgi:hypothetical protein